MKTYGMLCARQLTECFMQRTICYKTIHVYGLDNVRNASWERTTWYTTTYGMLHNTKMNATCRRNECYLKTFAILHGNASNDTKSTNGTLRDNKRITTVQQTECCKINGSLQGNYKRNKRRWYTAQRTRSYRTKNRTLPVKPNTAKRINNLMLWRSPYRLDRRAGRELTSTRMTDCLWVVRLPVPRAYIINAAFTCWYNVIWFI